MKTYIFGTSNKIAPLALRVFLALVLFPHGAQKLLGWFNGFGFTASMKYFTDTVGLPAPLGFLVILIEFFGPIALLLGIGTRIFSLGILAVMTGIVVTTFNQFFFMNWFGSQPSEGYEFFLLAIGMSASLLISGGGKFSLDRTLFKTA